MKVYLDNCMFNRPFDDQSHIRIRLEAEAKLYIQQQIRDGQIELVWSYILEYENAQNPHSDRQRAVDAWKQIAVFDIEESPALLDTARILLSHGVKAKDALHVASAIVGQVDRFLTTDDKLLKKLKILNLVTALNPLEYIKELPDGKPH